MMEIAVIAVIAVLAVAVVVLGAIALQIGRAHV